MSANATAKTWVGCQVSDTACITSQAQQIANLFAGFVKLAKHSLHIAIYDFRLDSAWPPLWLAPSTRSPSRALRSKSRTFSGH